jgi:hypothetical protein
MSLWDAVLGCLIVIGAIHRTEFTLPGHAAFELVAHLARGSLFERISATARHQRTSEKDRDRQGLHLLILGNERANARELHRGRVEAL